MPRILITGGAKRLGKGLALLFAKKGWDIAFSYFHSSDKAENTLLNIKQKNVSAYAFQADVRDYNSIQSGFVKMKKEFGIPDVLINNAAIFPNKQSLNELAVEDWQNVINTNLNSVFYTSKIFAENAAKNSRIINIASIGAFEIWDGRIAYHVSKAGVIQLTKALARELAPDISVNAVSPGTIDIENEPDSENVPQISNTKIPMKRYATVEDVFEACLFFAENSNFVTGTNIIVDGGYSLSK